MHWNLMVDSHIGRIELFEKEAACTIGSISSLLPLKIDLHYAKIAGQEVFGMIPLILPLENLKKVSDLDPGTVAYFPDRQMFCIYHGEVQPEDANVTVLGRLEPDPTLFSVFESVKTRESVFLFLSESDDFRPASHQVFQVLGQGWENFWHKPIPEIVDMVSRKGQTMPAGPILSASGDALKLIGVLWEFRKLLVEKGHFDPLSFNAVIGHFQEILGGWYGLRETASAISTYSQRITSGENRRADLEEMILFAGRLSMWIDSLIPWEAINNQFVIRYQRKK